MIRRDEKRPIIKGFLFFSLLLMYVVAYNLRIRSNQLLWFGVVGLAAITLFFVVLMRDKFQLTFMSKWMFVVYLYFMCSIFWSESHEFVNPLKSLIIIFAVSILLLSVVNNLKDLKTLIFINYLAILFSAVYLLFTVDMSALGEDRLGAMLETSWNSNNISTLMCMGFALALYFLGRSKRLFEKVFLLSTIALFVGIIFFCGSRTGLLLMLMICVLYLLVRARGKKKVGAILISISLIVLVYQLIMNYEPLYNVLGSRIEEMIDGLLGTSEDGSFNWRELMIQEGWRYFKEKPIFGYGIDNFRYIFGAKYGFFTYAHNNFIEILVGGGIVGFILYYSIYLYVFKGLWKYAVKEKEPLAIAIFVINLAKLISQYSSISYYNMDVYALLAFGVLYIAIREKEKANGESSLLFTASK